MTGATGFIGAVLLLELLADSDDHAVCLVRSRNGSSSEDRLNESIAAAANAYGRPELVDEAAGRLRAIDADLATLDVDPSAIGEVDTVWHIAASLNFSETQREETFQQNVEGTARLVDLSVALGAREFLYFSTAYVSGTATGQILERQFGSGDPPTNNPYEESKRRAEAYLLERDDIRMRILRPSMVIGHSETHAALTNTGMYAMLEGLRLLALYVERELGRGMIVIGDEGSQQNLVPVDAVARNAWRIHRSDSDAKIFHLVNGTPPTLGNVAETLAATLALRERPRLVRSRDDMSDIERTFADHPRNTMFEPYLTTRRVFDLTNTDAAVGPEASRYDLSLDGLRPYLEWYLRNVLRRPTPA